MNLHEADDHARGLGATHYADHSEEALHLFRHYFRRSDDFGFVEIGHVMPDLLPVGGGFNHLEPPRPWYPYLFAIMKILPIDGAVRVEDVRS